MILYGCAAHRVDVPSTTAGSHIAVRPGRAGFVVAAPHASQRRQHRRHRRRDRPAHRLRARRRLRLLDGEGRSAAGEPTLPGEPAARGRARPPGSEHEPTERARQVYELYEQRVLEAAQGPLRFYAEIHGNNRAQCAGQIEIATVGVDRELALRLRALAELIRDAHLRAHREIQTLRGPDRAGRRGDVPRVGRQARGHPGSAGARAAHRAAAVRATRLARGLYRTRSSPRLPR